MKKSYFLKTGLVIFVFGISFADRVINGYRVWINPNKTVFYAERGKVPKENITCESDCTNKCDYWWQFEKKGKWGFLEGQRPSDRFNSPIIENGSYRCAVFDVNNAYNYGPDFQIVIKDKPRNVSIEYAADDGDLWEGGGYITIRCNADCNPPCDSYQIYHNDTLKTTSSSRETRIRKVRENVGWFYCTASNSGPEYVTSINTVFITIKYQPKVAFNFPRNKTYITAPGSLDLSFIIDSFPPSNVTVYHKNDKLRTFPNVTGQHTFTTSIISCLDEGEYRVEAVNEIGSDSDTVVVYVKCQPPTSNGSSTELSTVLNKTATSEDTVLSPTSRRRKTINMREMEMKNLVLEHTKLGEEIQKLRAERNVLELKQQYYTSKLKQILKDHSG